MEIGTEVGCAYRLDSGCCLGANAVHGTSHDRKCGERRQGTLSHTLVRFSYMVTGHCVERAGQGSMGTSHRSRNGRSCLLRPLVRDWQCLGRDRCTSGRLFMERESANRQVDAAERLVFGYDIDRITWCINRIITLLQIHDRARGTSARIITSSAVASMRNHEAQLSARTSSATPARNGDEP